MLIRAGRRRPPTSPPTSPTTATSSSAAPDLMIDVLGADHHGYVARMQAAIAALGRPRGCVRGARSMQLVNLIEGGERARMSKRRGEFATLDELSTTSASTRPASSSSSAAHDTPLDIDLELARTASSRQPGLSTSSTPTRGSAASSGAARASARATTAAGHPVQLEPAERALISRLLELPGQVRAAPSCARAARHLGAYVARGRRRLPRLLPRLPAWSAPGAGLESARLELCDATRIVIATSPRPARHRGAGGDVSGIELRASRFAEALRAAGR